MINYSELISILSNPRPNGSRALFEVSHSLRKWLSDQGISINVQPFQLYPYFFELIGVWLILSRTLLALAIWLRWGWPTTVISLLGLAIGLLDVSWNIPTISRLWKCTGENLLIEFNPAEDPSQAKQEIIFSAHYDSKTELLDHRQRMFFLKSLPIGILLSLLLAVIGPLDRLLLDRASPLAPYSFALGVALSLPLLILAWGLGLNLSVGRLLPPSRGTVDNGTACAILLGLAERLNREFRLAKSSTDFRCPLQQTRVTLAIFAGEEVNMQGSRSYTRHRRWRLPAVAINLEAMAQDGPYVYWEKEGTSLRLSPTSPGLNQAIIDIVQEVTGQPPQPGGPMNSDGGSFLAAGIPATTIGTYHTAMVDRGFHRPTDNPDRVVMERIPEGVEILMRMIMEYDEGKLD